MPKVFSEEYKKYIISPKWQKKRVHIAILRKFTCERCKKQVKYGYHIHHKTYKHLGNEKDHELMFLCEECHKIIHIKKNKRKNKAKNKIKKYFICKYCLSKILQKRYITDYMPYCPFCSKYIGRPSQTKTKYDKVL